MSWELILALTFVLAGISGVVLCGAIQRALYSQKRRDLVMVYVLVGLTVIILALWNQCIWPTASGGLEMRFSKNLLWSLIVMIGLFTGTVLFLVNGDSPESVRIESSGENKPDG